VLGLFLFFDILPRIRRNEVTMRDVNKLDPEHGLLRQQLLETSIALEIVKTERNYLKTQLADTQFHLQHALQRAERMEHRLEATTRALTRMSESMITVSKQSSWVEVEYQGRPVLRLENPVGLPDRPHRLAYG